MGLPPGKESTLYLIDFGLARRYRYVYLFCLRHLLAGDFNLLLTWIWTQIFIFVDPESLKVYKISDLYC